MRVVLLWTKSTCLSLSESRLICVNARRWVSKPLQQKQEKSGSPNQCCSALAPSVLAIAQQERSTASHSWPDGVAVRVRMGLHTGDPERSTEGYVGLDVHRAARTMSAGYGWQIPALQKLILAASSGGAAP